MEVITYNFGGEIRHGWDSSTVLRCVRRANQQFVFYFNAFCRLQVTAPAVQNHPIRIRVNVVILGTVLTIPPENQVIRITLHCHHTMTIFSFMCGHVFVIATHIS